MLCGSRRPHTSHSLVFTLRSDPNVSVHPLKGRGTEKLIYCRKHFLQKVNKDDERILLNQCVVLGLNSIFAFECLDVVRIGEH